MRLADAAVRIGSGAVGADPISRSPNLVAAAKAAGAEAVHPGYGFLAESADFAEACVAAGLVFVGPPPAGDPRHGRQGRGQGADGGGGRALRARLPWRRPKLGAVRRGGRAHRLSGDGEGERRRRRTRHASSSASRRSSRPRCAAASAEAEAAFGDGRLLLERALVGARHVEIQVFGDERGQHRPSRRARLLDPAPPSEADRGSAVAGGVGRAARVDGRGGRQGGRGGRLSSARERSSSCSPSDRRSVLFPGDEHPHPGRASRDRVRDRASTCVRLQFQIAQGRRCPSRKPDIALSGHAIEARLYAEDPAADFLPSTGRIAAWRDADGEGVRVDCGVETGATVTALLQFPASPRSSPSAPTARRRGRRLVRALEATFVAGVTTNRDFLARARCSGRTSSKERRRPHFVEPQIAHPAAAEPDGDRARRAPVRRARRTGGAERGLARFAVAALAVDGAEYRVSVRRRGRRNGSLRSMARRCAMGLVSRTEHRSAHFARRDRPRRRLHARRRRPVARLRRRRAGGCRRSDL